MLWKISDLHFGGSFSSLCGVPVIIAMMAGCAAPPEAKVPERDPVAETLARYAASVSDSMKRMAYAEGSIRVEKEKTPPEKPAETKSSKAGPVEPAKAEKTAGAEEAVTQTTPQATKSVSPAGPAAAGATRISPEQERLWQRVENAEPRSATRGMPATYFDRPSRQAGPDAGGVIYSPRSQGYVRSADRRGEEPAGAAAVQPGAATSTSVTVVVNTGSPVAGHVVSPTAPAGPGTRVIASGANGLDKTLNIWWPLKEPGKEQGYADELENIIALICNEIGWTKGASVGRPISPIPVSIGASNKRAIDVLEDIGAFIGRSATIVVSADTRTISIQYPLR